MVFLFIIYKIDKYRTEKYICLFTQNPRLLITNVNSTYTKIILYRII